MLPMIDSILAFAILLPSASAAAPSPVEESMTVVVHLTPAMARSEQRSRTFAVVPGHTTNVRDLESSSSIEGALVEVLGGAAGAPMRVQVQYETSVSIMNTATNWDFRDWRHLPAAWLAFEGPNLDLRDWKHFTSTWMDLELDTKGRFRVGTLRDEERSKFPPVDREELLEAVRAAGGIGWANLVKDVSGPLDFPATVSLSAIRLRLLYGRPETTYAIEFLVLPSGC